MALMKKVAVSCRLFPGMFPSERIFEVTLANGEVYRSVAPREFCWNAADAIVEEGDAGEGVPGKVAGKLLSYDNLPADVDAIEVPDGEVLAFPRSSVHDRPTPIRPPSPRQSVLQGS